MRMGSVSPFGLKMTLCWNILPELSRATLRLFFSVAVVPSARSLVDSVLTVAENGAPVRGKIAMLWIRMTVPPSGACAVASAGVCERAIKQVTSKPAARGGGKKRDHDE